MNAARKKGRASVPAPQLVRQAPQPERRRKPPQHDRPRAARARNRGVPSWRWRRWGCWRWSCCPTTVLADDPDDEDPGWRLDEIYFVPPDPVPGRRIFIERLAVSGDTAAVTLRAAHDLDLKVQGLRRQAGQDPEDGSQLQPGGGPEPGATT